MKYNKITKVLFCITAILVVTVLVQTKMLLNVANLEEKNDTLNGICENTTDNSKQKPLDNDQNINSKSISSTDSKQLNGEDSYHRSNLDWTPVDDNPNDNNYIYYKIELDGETRNYHYLLKFDFDNNAVGGNRTLYENKWSRYEGGRIVGTFISKTNIVWRDTNKKNGTFSTRAQEFSFEILDNGLIICALGEDELNLAGTYKKALQSE